MLARSLSAQNQESLEQSWLVSQRRLRRACRVPAPGSRVQKLTLPPGIETCLVPSGGERMAADARVCVLFRTGALLAPRGGIVESRGSSGAAAWILSVVQGREPGEPPASPVVVAPRPHGSVTLRPTVPPLAKRNNSFRRVVGNSVGAQVSRVAECQNRLRKLLKWPAVMSRRPLLLPSYVTKSLQPPNLRPLHHGLDLSELIEEEALL